MIGIRRSEITEANDAGAIAVNGSEAVIINGQRCEVREVESLVSKIVRVDRKRSVVRRIQSPIDDALRAIWIAGGPLKNRVGWRQRAVPPVRFVNSNKELLGERNSARLRTAALAIGVH